jgi:hypothetical protein
MHPYAYIVIGFVSLLIVRYILNLYRYHRTNLLYTRYLEYMRSDDLTFAQYVMEIKSLFKEAQIKDSSVIHQEFLGFGKFANMQVSVFDNMHSNRQDIFNLVSLAFNQAIGVFRHRARETFSPIFWLEFLVKLPQYALANFGVLPQSIVAKIAIAIYWALAIFFGVKSTDLLHIFRGK